MLGLLLGLLVTGCSRDNRCSHGVNVMEEAELLAIYDREDYDEVFIVNPKGEEVAHYVLIGRDDTTKYTLPEGAVEIRVPLRNLVVDSEVYASALEELEAHGSIKGMFDAGFVTSPYLKYRISGGSIADVGQSTSPNTEKILALAPEAIMVSYYDGMQTKEIDKLGIPLIKMYDLQEQTPLGRAEWLRFLGRLSGRAEETDSIYDAVAEAYRKEKGEAGTASIPKILTEQMYEGVWYVPGGKSYQANLIKDAGGRYFMEDDTKTGSLNLSAEQVLAKGGDADIWLIRFYGDGQTLRSLLESDPVYGDIKAYKEGDVFFSDTSESALFREFPFHPDRLLRDYRIIFSGDSISPLHYFKKL